ncbi:uncharacterized protein DNG_08361 [Cephalotrichum gorgonifer]|uniref:UBA domain-containing protein Ucp14 n=1 Tax=Cephalotrichum gorgonifer TaxID=2041049 RepID=A0AAE8N4Z5_9PEZI|nr:uncharacterized protein DNG_08361 [Cephalotrichum gorgonifer]
MSFTNAPVTRSLVVGLVGTSMAATLFDAKHYFYIFADSHIWRHHQLWRTLTYQLCFVNSSEVLFACATLYQMRVVERMWGSRKFASFLIVTSLFTAVIPPLLITLLQPLTSNLFNYLPAGPTALIFALLAQYHAIIPHVYRYHVATTSSSPSPSPSTGTPGASASAATDSATTTDPEPSGFTLTDKSPCYLLALQLALFQFPASLITAPLGFLLGYSFRSDLLPPALTRWRLPGWLVGSSAQKRSAEFEGLRRRLEGEDAEASASASASGRERRGEMGVGQRATGTVGREIFNQFL